MSPWGHHESSCEPPWAALCPQVVAYACRLRVLLRAASGVTVSAIATRCVQGRKAEISTRRWNGLRLALLAHSQVQPTPFDPALLNTDSCWKGFRFLPRLGCTNKQIQAERQTMLKLLPLLRCTSVSQGVDSMTRSWPTLRAPGCWRSLRPAIRAASCVELR